MSVVARQARRRWLIVAALVAVLCSLPAALAALPVSSSGVGPAELRRRVLAAADLPYQGLAETRGSLGLPDLPGLSDATDLLSGTTRIRAWYESRSRWRVDSITPTGERGVYRTPKGLLIWDFERDQLTRVTGEPAIRLPRAADLLPPALAARLLSVAGRADRMTGLPARRVAGVEAAGLRLTPGDRDTTVGHVDIWADPDSGLAVEVRVAARGFESAALRSRFLDLRRTKPSPRVVRMERAPDFTVNAPDVISRLSVFGPESPPDRLAGRAVRPLHGGPIMGARAYGSGFASFAVMTLPGRYGRRVLNAAERAGAEQFELPGGAGFRLRTPLVNGVVAHDHLRDDTFLIAGPVSPDTLSVAARQLVAQPRTRF